MRALIAQFYHWLLNRLVFAGKTGEIDFYGLDEPESPPVDGYVMVRATFIETSRDAITGDEIDAKVTKELTYSFRFENRYMMHLSPHARAVALWSRLTTQCPNYRPLLMIEHGKAYTPFCAYDSVPPSLARRLNLPTLPAVGFAVAH